MKIQAHESGEGESLTKNLAASMLSLLKKSYIWEKMIKRFQLNRFCTP
jgi:hypothetical protein